MTCESISISFGISDTRASGTGASAIYPLVACRQYSSWLFLGTEIDAKSRSFAARNIKNNDLDSRIKIIDTDSESKLLVPSDELERFQKYGPACTRLQTRIRLTIIRIDVLITNPPFYASAEELEALAKQKSRPPNSACTGAPVEMIYPGGEVEFVTQLVQESTIAPNRTMIQWFSSMFGKLGSVNTVIERLREKGCTNYAVTEFVQGQRTRRWCVAWTWSGLRPSNAIARGTDAVEKKYLPFPTELDITVDSPINEVTETIRHEVSALHEVQWKWNADTRTGMGRSMTGDVWSRKARRRLQKQAVEQDSMEVDIPQPKAHPGSSKTSGGGAHATESEPEDDPQFVFRISVNTVHDEASEDKATNRGVTVNIRWLRGHDSTIFESFHGWLNRKLQD